MEGRKLSILCYIEGYLIPVKTISIVTQVGIPSIVSITTLPFGMREEIMPTSRVMIFYAYQSKDMDNPWDEYKLLFHGETTGVGVSQSGTNAEMLISAIDTRSYLNRLPDKVWGALYQNSSAVFYNYFLDADFYGMAQDRAIRQWLKESIGFFAEKSKYKLKEYVDKLFSLLRIDKFPYCYYHNANHRYRVVNSHHVVDSKMTSSENSEEVFEAIWGSMYKDSMIQNMNNLLMTGEATSLDNLVQGLVSIGYNYTHIIAPKFMEKAKGTGQNGLYEYLITRDLIGHRVPKFNYIYVDRDDSLNVSLRAPEITATKYKYKSNIIGDGPNIPIENTVYPQDAMDGTSLKMTDDEKIYGINRQVVDMNYFYNEFLKSKADDTSIGKEERESMYLRGQAGKKGDILYAKQAYEFMLKRTGNNSVSIHKGSFIPEYVLGMPAIVHDPLTGGMYRGNIWRLSYVISIETGMSNTSIDMVNVQQMNSADDADKEAEGGANPIGKDYFNKKEVDMYRELFYREDPDNEVRPMLSSSDITSKKNHRQYYKFIERDHCTMGEYVRMMDGNIDELPEEIPQDMGVLSLSDEFVSLEKNHKEACKYGDFDMKHAFIEERRERARVLHTKLKERIQYVQ